ncbi:hypothetical protein ACFVX6_14025 [Streptomyces sp. NPDC058289]|uniref:hypothetical protein n=1 Tax=Streptomyces sp. NPDC058289 TaxID=3346425 RepID=UPI0036E2E6C1
MWGYSALRTGLAIAPGPLLVPPVALRVGPAVVARFGAGRIAMAGTVLFAAGILRHGWCAVAAASLLAACATIPLVRKPRPAAATETVRAEAATVGDA